MSEEPYKWSAKHLRLRKFGRDLAEAMLKRQGRNDPKIRAFIERVDAELAEAKAERRAKWQRRFRWLLPRREQ
jgi:hypothetical protein